MVSDCRTAHFRGRRYAPRRSSRRRADEGSAICSRRQIGQLALVALCVAAGCVSGDRVLHDPSLCSGMNIELASESFVSPFKIKYRVFSVDDRVCLPASEGGTVAAVLVPVSEARSGPTVVAPPLLFTSASLSQSFDPRRTPDLRRFDGVGGLGIVEPGMYQLEVTWLPRPCPFARASNTCRLLSKPFVLTERTQYAREKSWCVPTS